MMSVMIAIVIDIVIAIVVADVVMTEVEKILLQILAVTIWKGLRGNSGSFSLPLQQM